MTGVQTCALPISEKQAKPRPIRNVQPYLIDPDTQEQWTRSFGTLIQPLHPVENLGFEGSIHQTNWGPRNCPGLLNPVMDWVSMYWNIDAMGWIASCISASIRNKLSTNSISLECSGPFVDISAPEMVGYFRILLKSTHLKVPLKDLWSLPNK